MLKRIADFFGKDPPKPQPASSPAIGTSSPAPQQQAPLPQPQQVQPQQAQAQPAQPPQPQQAQPPQTPQPQPQHVQAQQAAAPPAPALAPPAAAGAAAPPAQAGALFNLTDASQAAFDRFDQILRQDILTAIGNPHSFLRLNNKNLQDVMDMPHDRLPSLIRSNNDFTVGTQHSWNSPPRTQQQASTLADVYFNRDVMPYCGGPSRTHHVPFAETMRYRPAFVNALMQGLDLPVLPHTGPPVLSDQDVLLKSTVGRFVNSALQYGMNLSGDGTLAGRDPASMTVALDEVVGNNPMGTLTKTTPVIATKKGPH